MASTYRSAASEAQVRAWCDAALGLWRIPHQSHRVMTSLGETHLVSAGAGDRICLYLPGTNFNASTSAAVIGALAAHCQVYAADLPGQPGLSTATRPVDALVGDAGWLADLLDWLAHRHGPTPVVVAGHSRGAAVALAADPGRVAGLALFSPAGLLAVRPTVAMLRATLPWLARRNRSGARRLLIYMSGPDHAPTDDLVDWMTLLARVTRTTGAPGPLPDAIVHRWRGENALVAVGEQDVFFPVHALRGPTRERLGLDLVVVPGAGHLLTEEQPAEVAEMVAGLF